MIYQGGKRAKIISAATADEFERKLNAEMERLDRSRSKYEITFNNNLGFCAYIMSETSVQIPETVEDEFELAGEKHTCIECPHWVHPTRGNVKYTRCPVAGGIHGAQSPCCETFYQQLLNGEIEIEVR